MNPNPSWETGIQPADRLQPRIERLPESAVPFWRRLLPAWVGAGIGALLVALFLVVGNPANWKHEDRFFYYTNNFDPTSKGIKRGDYAALPFLMPIFGFSVGFLVVMWRTARSRAES